MFALLREFQASAGASGYPPNFLVYPDANNAGCTLHTKDGECVEKGRLRAGRRGRVDSGALLLPRADDRSLAVHRHAAAQCTRVCVSSMFRVLAAAPVVWSSPVPAAPCSTCRADATTYCARCRRRLRGPRGGLSKAHDRIVRAPSRPRPLARALRSVLGTASCFFVKTILPQLLFRRPCWAHCVDGRETNTAFQNLRYVLSLSTRSCVACTG